MSQDIFIDFEYHSANNPHPTLVSCALLVDGKPENYWLFEAEEGQHSLKARIQELVVQKRRLVAFQASAEARCLLALGLDPLAYTWVDLYCEWAQMTNHCDDYGYGTVLDSRKGTPIRTTSPRVKKEIEAREKAEEEDRWVPSEFAESCDDTGRYDKPSKTLAAATFKMLGVRIDTQNKKEVRDIIISKNPALIKENSARILAYGESDVVYLPALALKLKDAFRKQFLEKKFWPLYDSMAESRAQFTVAMAYVERNGIPLDFGIIERVVAATPEIMMGQWIRAREVSGLPLFDPLEHKLNKKTGLPLKTSRLGVFKAAAFQELIERKGLLETWPKTASGALSTEDKLLKKMSMQVPELVPIRDTRKVSRDLGWLSPKKKTDKRDGFYDGIGTDRRIRTYFGPFGTQTGRNAAKARTFPFAMSSWIRSIIRPPAGYFLTGADFRAQEIMVGASMSGDKNLIETYYSADVYLDFAHKTGAVPDGWEQDKKAHDAVRQIYKAVVLGINFGMGAESLALNLTEQTKRQWTVPEAEELIKKHQRVYPDYWKFREQCLSTYNYGGKGLQISGDWFLGPDNPNKLSVANCPIQGMAAAVLRLSVVECIRAGLEVIAPLHDAIYIIHKTPEEVDLLVRIMRRSSKEALSVLAADPREIDVTTKTISSDEYYVEGKGKAMFEKYKKIITGS